MDIGCWKRPIRGKRCCTPNATPVPIHLLLTDVVMPGMTGPELAGRLKPLRPAMEVIFMSGYSERAIADRSGIGQVLIFKSRFLLRLWQPK